TIPSMVIINATNGCSTTGLPEPRSGILIDTAGTAIVAGGGTGLTTLTAYAILVGGTTATASLQQILPSSTAGDVLTSNGATALPVWSAPTAQIIQTATVALTNAEVKGLGTTPITLVAAPGSGKVINVLNCFVKLNYGGNDPFTMTGTDHIELFYTNSSGQKIYTAAMSHSAFTSSQSKAAWAGPDAQTGINFSGCDNAPVVIWATGAVAGNASNDNTLTVVITYEVLTI
ncbi:MAG: hypothetical protein NTU89_04490, partial [Candidatus Dependentiae bacterium]|nr:hypothetical protein [Candidatus Dependentiae bacterium]